MMEMSCGARSQMTLTSCWNKPQVDAGRVVVDHVPEFALADQVLDLADRSGVDEGVVDGEHFFLLFGQLDQRTALLDRFGHRLFQPAGPPALDGPLGQLEVGGDRRGDGHERPMPVLAKK